MSWFNPPKPWSELVRELSGVPAPHSYLPGDERSVEATREEQTGEEQAGARTGACSSDAPAPTGLSGVGGTSDNPAYAELHAHSNFSFLDGASHPEELVAEAERLGLSALALTDHDGVHGAVRFAEAAAERNIDTVFGSELSLDLPSAQDGVADPAGRHLLVLARNAEGYARLCHAISSAHLRGGEKGRPVYDWSELAEQSGGQWQVLTGCRKGPVRAALAEHGVDAAATELERLVGSFGAEHVAVELTYLGTPTDTERNDVLHELAGRAGVSTVATTGAHVARPERARMASVVAAIRARRSLDEIDGWLPAWAGNHLRSGAEMNELFRRYPAAVRRAAELGQECAFDLRLVAPQLPPYQVPCGHTEASWLRELVRRGATERYGTPAERPDAHRQLERELRTIEDLGFPGYFLVVQDIVEFCRNNDVLCQGRGSAANSAVCFALRITNVDPVRYQLLFERFLSPQREGPPDIDVDIESGRREEVIQYVYRKYGRRHAAQVANVIGYRPKSAVRDVARALGCSPGQQDAWSKEIEHSAFSADSQVPGPVRELAVELVDFPRHLGVHTGGMVICHQPVSEVCPVEWARMPGRTVLQWDKDDCGAVGLVKFDLLGLGMLSALHHAIDLVRAHHGVEVDLGELDLTDDAVYAMLRRADAVGVFQVESRAQLGALPRLKPREFYDLVVQVALIRPGPIQGGSVHPYIRRRNGQEDWDYEHPLMAGALAKTLGVPLFQEQLMQLAVDLAGFTAAEADELRRAMGSKRSSARMRRLRRRLFDGMAERGIHGELAERVYARLAAFANYGFPESHALSFALLVFASAWFKHYYPAVFCAALLRAQPMGFYSPQSLVADARRHGVRTHGADINASAVAADLEPDPDSTGGKAVRLGLSAVREVGADLAQNLVTERDRGGSYANMADVGRRVSLRATQLEALATAGAFGGLGLSRREALWHAAAAATESTERLPGTVVSSSTPPLPGMDEVESAAADVWSTGLSPKNHPVRFVRGKLNKLAARPAATLSGVDNGTRVLVGGAVTHRQRPATAGGITFLNLEDETGMVNVMCSPGLWSRYRRVARNSSALLVRGIVERSEGMVNLRADRLSQLDLSIPASSRDFC